jgi:hypothetical protein
MPSKYYLTLTTYGSDLIAQAHESAPLNLKNLVIGDANGVPYDPLTAIDRTHLVNQKASVLIQHLEVIDDVVRIQATVGANIGGFNIHEIGLTDETGQLVYIGNYHGGYKSLFEDGAGGELTISIDIKGVAANQINLNIDPNTNTATQAWVQQKLNEMMNVINRKEDIKIGDLFITTTLFADSDAVHEHKGFGVWQKFGDGHALVLRSTADNENVPEWMSVLGNTGGEAKHLLTIDEMPLHDHEVLEYGGPLKPGLHNENRHINAPTNDASSKRTGDAGGGQPHNIIQPSIIVDAWLRIS